MDVPFWLWAAVLGLILAMLAVDLLAHRRAHVVGVREAGAWTAVWVSLGLAFGGVVWWMYGPTAGGEYFAGYLIEKSLAVDNVFVFALIFGYFAVPRMYQHRVLYWGILGALAMRAVFIAGGAALIDRFHWVLYVFGAILLYTGWRMFRHRNHEMDLSTNPVLRLARRLIPTTEDYDGQKFWVRRAGRWVATPLFMVLVLVETTDIIFAVDSIPAIFAITLPGLHQQRVRHPRVARHVLPPRRPDASLRLPQGRPGRHPHPGRHQDAAHRHLEGPDRLVTGGHHGLPDHRGHREPSRHPID